MVYLSSRAGKRHQQSEDAVLVGSDFLNDTTKELQLPASGFVCVADGVGGNAGGAQASKFVLCAAAEYDPCKKDQDLRSFLISVNEDLIQYAAQDGQSANMATTLTGFLFSDTAITLLHVGNTRAYIKQGKYLKQITSDHTTYNWLVSNGQLEAAEQCNRSEITSCFGGGRSELLSKLFIAEYPAFSVALLTSDGIHDFVNIDTLEDILNNDEPYPNKCESIITQAIASGSEDDLTVVIISNE